jgi:hypothetical protein
MGAIDTIEFSDHSVSTAITRYGEQKLLLGVYEWLKITWP